MERDVIWNVMTETVEGKHTITLVNCIAKKGEEFESYEVGDIVRTKAECLISKVPAGTDGKVVHLADPIRYPHFIYAEFGEGSKRKMGTFGLGQLHNITDELTNSEPVTVA